MSYKSFLLLPAKVPAALAGGSIASADEMDWPFPRGVGEGEYEYEVPEYDWGDNNLHGSWCGIANDPGKLKDLFGKEACYYKIDDEVPWWELRSELDGSNFCVDDFGREPEQRVVVPTAQTVMECQMTCDLVGSHTATFSAPQPIDAYCEPPYIGNFLKSVNLDLCKNACASEPNCLGFVYTADDPITCGPGACCGLRSRIACTADTHAHKDAKNRWVLYLLKERSLLADGRHGCAGVTYYKEPYNNTKCVLYEGKQHIVKAARAPQRSGGRCYARPMLPESTGDWSFYANGKCGSSSRLVERLVSPDIETFGDCRKKCEKNVECHYLSVSFATKAAATTCTAKHIGRDRAGVDIRSFQIDEKSAKCSFDMFFDTSVRHSQQTAGLTTQSVRGGRRKNHNRKMNSSSERFCLRLYKSTSNGAVMFIIESSLAELLSENSSLCLSSFCSPDCSCPPLSPVS